MQNMCDGDRLLIGILGVVASVCVMGGWMYYCNAERDVAEARARADVVSTMSQAGRSDAEISAVLLKWDGRPNDSVDDKRAQLAKDLHATKRMNAEDIDKIVKTCYKDDDFVAARKIELSK